MEIGLGALKNIDPRQKWPHEASNFTPWLAQHLEMLGEAVGLELELEDIEVAVGPYSADILAKDPGTGHFVVIENQLGKTNHDHLGKSITYASVLDASAIIWIATNFTEEHKKALDWLNDHTSHNISFYGMIVELWQIDDSKPAVRFNVISRPTDIVRQTSLSTSNLTETKQLQLEFWTKFRARLLEMGKLPSVQSARPQYWYDVSLGRSGINLSNIANTYDKHIGVRVYISNKVTDAALPQLMEMKNEIEQEIGSNLQWDPNPENRDKIIALTKDADISLKEKWDEYIEWMAETTVIFHTTFAKRIKNLDLTTNQQEPE